MIRWLILCIFVSTFEFPQCRATEGRDETLPAEEEDVSEAELMEEQGARNNTERNCLCIDYNHRCDNPNAVQWCTSKKQRKQRWFRKRCPLLCGVCEPCDFMKEPKYPVNQTDIDEVYKYIMHEMALTNEQIDELQTNIYEVRSNMTSITGALDKDLAGAWKAIIGNEEALENLNETVQVLVNAHEVEEMEAEIEQLAAGLNASSSESDQELSASEQRLQDQIDALEAMVNRIAEMSESTCMYDTDCGDDATCDKNGTSAQKICHCPEQWTGELCTEDANECETGAAKCDTKVGSCQNKVGSYSCSCNSGYRLQSDGYTCEDINECTEQAPCGSRSTCTNSPGSYSCKCHSGFADKSTGQDRACRNINECADGTHQCDLTTTTCSDSTGSYSCPCKTGFKYVNGRKCSNINECNAGSPCGSYANCADNIGSYTCTCKNTCQYRKDNSGSSTSTCSKTSKWWSSSWTATNTKRPYQEAYSCSQSYQDCDSSGNCDTKWRSATCHRTKYQCYRYKKCMWYNTGCGTTELHYSNCGNKNDNWYNC